MSERFVCVDCGESYILSYDEQRSYRERGWELPKRCPACLARRRYERNSAPIQTGQGQPSQPGRPDRSLRPVRSLTAWWSNPYARFGWLGLGLALLIAMVIMLWLGFSGWVLALAWLVAINLVTLIVYRYDKAIAGGESTRVPEAVLLALAFFGGSPAAYFALYHFKERHKVQKMSFILPFWLIVTGQVLTLCSLPFWLGWI
ncbi:MAG TPA: DUF1294 domain-containing protein [Anaerolineae bacterium]|nr:DUF1294 domain-containing protein [Anaerolineae bacterium]